MGASTAGRDDRAVREPAAGEVPLDHSGWDEIVRTHWTRVHRLALRLTGDRDDADDLTQEVFIRVFRSLGSYVPGTFEGWLHRITVNLFLDGARRRRRLRFDALTEEISARLPDRGATPERAFEADHLDVDVLAALDRLSPAFRAVVVLADVEGMTYEEVAETLGLKLGTVRSRLHRARGQLRRSLQHRAPRPPRPVLRPTGRVMGFTG